MSYIDGNLTHFDALSSADEVETNALFYPKGNDMSPELRLVLAIIEDCKAVLEGFRTCNDGGNVTKKGKNRLFLDAAAWVLDERSSWLYSFNHCCELLGLSPSAVRKHWSQQFNLGRPVEPGFFKQHTFGRPQRVEVPDWFEYGFDHRYVKTTHCQQCKLRFERAARRSKPENWKGPFGKIVRTINL